MNALFEAAEEIQSFCQEAAWQFCFIGGIAVQRWGQPRFTQDVDLTLLTGFGSESAFIDRLLERFPSRRPDGREFALQFRVLLLNSSQGIPLDIALGALPFEVRTVERASVFPIGAGRSILTCSAEDLIIHKSFAGRDHDWSDVESVLLRQGRSLDLDLVFSELEPLLALKEEPEVLERLRRLAQKCAGAGPGHS